MRCMASRKTELTPLGSARPQNRFQRRHFSTMIHLNNARWGCVFFFSRCRCRFRSFFRAERCHASLVEAMN